MSDTSEAESLIVYTIRVSSSGKRHKKYVILGYLLYVWVERDFKQGAELPRGRFTSIGENFYTSPWGRDLTVV